MKIEYLSAEAFEPELPEILNQCFEGYLFPVRFDRRAVAKMVRVDSVDLSASVVVQHEGQAIGVALVARRGWNCRLAGMSIAPNFRGQRAGTGLVDFLIRSARERGDRSFLLEVIEQNTPAMRLYQAAGFTSIRRLVGYTADLMEAMEETALEEIDPVEAAVAVSRWGVEALPDQISPHTLTALGPPYRAFRLGPATAMISSPTAEIITICALVVESGARRRGWAGRGLRALSARFPGKKWRIPILVPEEIPAACFTRLGFHKENLSQIQMKRPI